MVPTLRRDFFAFILTTNMPNSQSNKGGDTGGTSAAIPQAADRLGTPNSTPHNTGNNMHGAAAASAVVATRVAEAKTPHHPSASAEKLLEGAGQAFEEVGEITAGVVRGTFSAFFAYTGELVFLFWETVSSLVRRGLHAGDFVRQMSVIGVESIPIALLTVGFSGAVLALYLVDTLRNYGAGDLVGGVVALSIVRETAPILAGVALAARAGSAITAEIGSMKVTEQIDALRSLAVSPIAYLVVPRFVAAIVMMPVICVFADIAGLFGGGIVANNFGIAPATYVNSIRQLLSANGWDITQGLIKTVVFGALIALVGCREGLATEGGATGVGQATNRSVVIAIVLVFIANFILSFLMFGGRLY